MHLQGRDVLQLSVDAALALFGVEHMEIVRAPATDSKCLVAWGPSILVLSFRGTVTGKNMRADAKVHVPNLSPGGGCA